MTKLYWIELTIMYYTMDFIPSINPAPSAFNECGVTRFICVNVWQVQQNGLYINGGYYTK